MSRRCRAASTSATSSWPAARPCQVGIRHPRQARGPDEPAYRRRQSAFRRTRRAPSGTEHSHLRASSDLSRQLSGFVADNRREIRARADEAEPGARTTSTIAASTSAKRSSGCRRSPLHWAKSWAPVLASPPTSTVCPPPPISGVLLDTVLPAGQAARQPGRLLARFPRRAHDHQAEITMRTRSIRQDSRRSCAGRRCWSCWRWLAWCGAYLAAAHTPPHTVIGLLLLCGGSVPWRRRHRRRRARRHDHRHRTGPSRTKITMSMRGDVDVPADARAIIMAPNLVSARFIEFAPVYNGGPKLANGAIIGPDRTAVPVEWDEVKDQLTQLSAQLGPQPGSLQGPLAAFVNQAADTFDGNGESFRQAVRELSQTAGPARGFPLRPPRHGQEPAHPDRCALAQQRADREVLQPCRVGLAGARGQLDRPRRRSGHTESGAHRHPRLPQGQQRRADRDKSTSWPTSPSCSPITATTSSRCFTSPPTGWPTSTTCTTRRRASIAGLLTVPELRQPRPIHLRRLSMPVRRRTTSSAPKSAASAWARSFDASR